MRGATRKLTRLDEVEGGEDENGRTRKTWQDGPTFDGNLFQKSIRESSGGVLTVVSQWWARVPVGSGFTTSSRVRSEDGQTFDVQGVVTRHGPPGFGPQHVSLQLEARSR